MKNTICFFLITCFISSCINDNKNLNVNSSVDQIKKQAVKVAENYVNGQLKDSKKTMKNDGSIIFSAGDTKCLIDPSYIIIGEIDGDSYKDAIVSIFTFNGQRLPLKEHLILINKNGKLWISKELNGEMKFLSISNRTIFIETSKMAPDSPFADCQACKVIKKYKFIAGDTVIIK